MRGLEGFRVGGVWRDFEGFGEFSYNAYVAKHHSYGYVEAMWNFPSRHYHISQLSYMLF